MLVFTFLVLILQLKYIQKSLIPHASSFPQINITLRIIPLSSAPDARNLTQSFFDDFHLVTDGPFSVNCSSWSTDYSSVCVRLPPNPLNGIVLLFHGCHHSGVDFFRLIEERTIVSDLNRRNFGAISFTSSDVSSRCWSGEDIPSVKRSFDRLKLNPSLPIFAFGASSGGSFVTMLPANIPIDGVICEISPGDPFGLERLNVPIVFIYMAMDLNWASRSAVEIAQKALTAKGIVNKAFELEPFHLTPGIFAEKLPEFFKMGDSKQLFEELINKKWIGSDGKLTGNPRQMPIMEDTLQFVQNKGIIKENQAELVGENIMQIYNTAWAVHEMTHERVAEAIDFLLNNTKKVIR